MNSDTCDVTSCEVAIVGGGPAGLAAATALARSLRSVVVVDAGEPRNAPAAGAHNVLGHEGIAPRDLLAAGRAELVAYGGILRTDRVRTVTRDDDGFALSLASGERLHARRLILATGLVDELPDIPGVAALWGTDVLHCPYCHGWEVRGKRIAVIATNAMVAHEALLFRQLSEHVSVVAHAMPSLPEADAARLAARGIDIVDAAVDHLDVVVDDDGNARLGGVVLTDGSTLAADAVVVAPRFVARTDLYEQLGGTASPHPMGGTFIETGVMGQTAVPGVWAAGNTADLAAMVTVSMGAGVQAGAAVNADLVAQDADALVTAMATR